MTLLDVMEFSKRAYRRMWIAGWVIVWLLAVGAPGRAQLLTFESAGARIGLGANESSALFRQAEGFVNWDLPWHWNLGNGWRLQSRLDLSAGWLGSGSRNGFVASVGPLLALGSSSFPVSLEGGVSPTLLSRWEFEEKNFGIPLQFTSYAGLNWDFAPHLRLGYRFEHISNAGLSSHNPGLNMHLLALGYRF